VSEVDQASREVDRADRSLFIQELLLALMSESSDTVLTGSSNEQEFHPSVENLLSFDVDDALLLKSASCSAASSQLCSASFLADVCDDTDSHLVTNSQTMENCDPIGKESFNVGGLGATGGFEVACSKAGGML